ncbi:uncharacterized protein AMSG_04406 [Thecamonas trahens ATCC 50062]|uniref:C2 domain-containing protein n=1 Tax=Thecamonas trahens ATCC 50062 TaxID=461836 RepID=A0A0L0DA58_THETB|nr:hypothetical protein AMSG_04406 [Thecamonas trahens ATCC 50062]KNC48178.1 hypothetical protein AMSG_04406 [Thecamonas trahens ATCC 50062]|eukprot:XP_013758748.1 hypothetical protein AMSG_04406 [Thecamonas trahens ATCC 50062]
MAATRAVSAKVFIEIQAATPYEHVAVKSPDTYVVVKVNAKEVHQTKRINNSRQPVWGEGDDRAFSATVGRNDILYFQLVDHNTLRKDIVLGDGLLRIADLERMKVGATNCRVPIQLHSDSAIADPTQQLPLMCKLILHIDVSQLIACGVITPVANRADAAATATGTKPTEPQAPDAAVLALKEANTMFITLLKAGNTAEIAALYNDEALLAPPPADALPMPIVVGRARIRAFWTGVVDSEVADFAFGDAQFEHVGREAQQSGPYSTENGTGVRRVHWREDDDGNWHIARESFDGPLPVPSAATAALLNVATSQPSFS